MLDTGPGSVNVFWDFFSRLSTGQKMAKEALWRWGVRLNSQVKIFQIEVFTPQCFPWHWSSHGWAQLSCPQVNSGLARSILDTTGWPSSWQMICSCCETCNTRTVISWTARRGQAEHPITSEVVQNICLCTAASVLAELMKVGKLFCLLDVCGL